MEIGGVYLVTNRHLAAVREPASVVGAAVAGGVRTVQLREKDLPARELFRLAMELGGVVRGAGGRLVVNGRVDVALAAGADGVHLGGDALPVAEARHIAWDIAGPGFLIGASVHSLEEARAATAEGADYLIFGHVFATPSKEGTPGRGLEVLRAVCAAVTVPVLAIGGIAPANAGPVRQAGAAGVAVMSGIMAAGDPERAAAELTAAWEADFDE